MGFSSKGLSTIINADFILVLQHGTLIEQGNHAEFLSKKGTYAALWLMQTL